MKSLLTKCSVLFLAFAIGSIVYLAAASTHVDLWKKEISSTVYFNGQLSKSSVVYRRADGLRLLRTAEDGAWYIFEEPKLVYYCSSFDLGSRQVLVLKLPGYLYTWRRNTFPCMGSEQVIGRPAPNRIEFKSIEENRIWITW